MTSFTAYSLPSTSYWLRGTDCSWGELDSLSKPWTDQIKSAGCALGSLQRINFRLFLNRGFRDMRGHAALPGSPFDGRLRENKAILAGGKIFDFLTAVTLLNNGMAAPTIELAAILAHEKAFDTLLYAVANHGYHIPS